MSLTSEVQAFITAEVTSAEIVAHFPDENPGSVRAILHRLEKAGRIVAVARGVYGPGDPEAVIVPEPRAKKRRKMTLNEYVKNRDDITMLTIGQTPDGGFDILLRLDGTYSSYEVVREQAKFVSKTLGIPLAGE